MIGRNWEGISKELKSSGLCVVKFSLDVVRNVGFTRLSDQERVQWKDCQSKRNRGAAVKQCLLDVTGMLRP